MARRLHTGRSRNEQVSLDLRLYLRRRLPRLQRAVAALVATLADRAAAAGTALMPAYTHLRRAQPVLVAHFFLAHAAALQRDHARFDHARDEADALPLGSGAVAGTSYPIDVDALAARLGFSRVAANSVDAAADRDFVSSMLHACALLMVHLSRLAEDLILFTAEEFGFFELDDGVATGSSLMPQKKNPDPLELVRGKAGRVVGRAAGWLATMKGCRAATTRTCRKTRRRCSTPSAPPAGRCRRWRPSWPAWRSGRAPANRRPADCCWRPTSPTISSNGGCRSAARTRWSAASSASCWPAGATSRR